MPKAIGSVYGNAMYQREGLLAAWLPDKPLQVGDVIARSAATGMLTVETSLLELTPGTGWAQSQRAGGESLVLHSGVTIETDVGSSASSVGAVAQLTLRFERGSSFAFSGRDITISEYPHIGPIRSQLLTLYAASAWDVTWQLVTSVRSVKRATIIIARESGTAARVAVDATSGLKGFEAAAVSAGISITRGDAVKWELKDSTPLYEAIEVIPGNLFRASAAVNARYLEDLPREADGPRVVVSSPHDLAG